MGLRKIITSLLAVALLATPFIGRAEEQHSITTDLSNTTLSGYVDTSGPWWVGGGSGNGGLPGRTFSPENDDVAAAQIVTAAQVSIPTNLTSATLELGEPVQPKQTGSVWYRWDVTQSGVARIATSSITPVTPPSATSTTSALSDESIFYPNGGIIWIGSGETVVVVGGVPMPPTMGYVRWGANIVVYRAIRLSDTEMRFEFVQRGALQFNVNAGDTFLIGIEVYENTPAYEGEPEIPSSLPTVLNFDLTPPPPNDSFASDFTVSETAGGRFDGHTLAATREPGEPNLGAEFSGGSVWFHYKAATYGKVTLASDNVPIAVFSGTNVSDLMLLGKTESGQITFFGEEGKVYHLAAYHRDWTSTNFTFSYAGPKYRLFETNIGGLFPSGMRPHFYGVRGETMLLYAKSATGWNLVEVEPIVDRAADLSLAPSDAIDGQLRVITIDERPPSPHVVLTQDNGVFRAELVGIQGQSCAISYSSDLINWSEPRFHRLTSSSEPLDSIDGNSSTYFYRVTQSLSPITVTLTGGGSQIVVPDDVILIQPPTTP